MSKNSIVLAFVTFLTPGMAFAQNAARTPSRAAEPHVVRLEKGYVCGWCGGAGYRTTITTVRPHYVVEELADAEDPKENPNRKEKQPITKQQWETLVRSIDAKALRAVPQDGICRPCIDQPDAWVVVEYSDGSKIPVNYPPGSEPAAVKALKIPGIPIAFYPHSQHSRP